MGTGKVLTKAPKKRNTGPIPVYGPGGNERGPGSQAKEITKAGYPSGNDACMPNKVGQKGKTTRTHQGLYN